jgi:exonuclease III
VRRVSLSEGEEILLAATHFPSKRHELYKASRDRQKLVSAMSAKIREIESRVGHSRTILVGDMNMNPFEEDMISANGWHAVMTRDIASKRTRWVQKESYPFFYNPMWGYFGDNTQGPPGTYYSRKGSLSEYFWHMWDQVLIRPDLLGSFDGASLQILTGCRSASFVKRSGIPDNSRFSDHLPLLFALEI